MDTGIKPKTTPKDFFLWLGSMTALYVLVFAFINLLFAYIDSAFPDALSYAPLTYSGSMRFNMAALVVLFPIFIILMRLIRDDTRADPEKKELWIRRWIVVLTIFFAGAAAAIDLIVLVSSFLGGDMTAPFLLKVAVVFLVAGALFLHTLAYLKGYWESHQREILAVAWGGGIAILAALIAGFALMGAPWNVRLYRFDDQKISDLQSIQWQVLNYWELKGALPAALADINDPLSGFTVPADPQTGASYEYQPIGKNSFELCATFNAETQSGSPYAPASSVPAGAGFMNSTWVHASGHDCFLRTIDPARYSPAKK